MICASSNAISGAPWKSDIFRKSKIKSIFFSSIKSITKIKTCVNEKRYKTFESRMVKVVVENSESYDTKSKSGGKTKVKVMAEKSKGMA